MGQALFLKHEQNNHCTGTSFHFKSYNSYNFEIYGEIVQIPTAWRYNSEKSSSIQYCLFQQELIISVAQDILT